MGKYIKTFGHHSDYLDFLETSDFIMPNVSYCEDVTDEVHYNPLVSKIIATFSLSSAGSTRIYCWDDYEYSPVFGVNMFSDIEIDGVSVSVADLDAAQGMYNLSSGQHTVTYTLISPSEVPYSTFYSCDKITAVTIPEGVSVINNGAFCGCANLVSVTIPSTLTEIYDCSFNGCNNLNSASRQALIDIGGSMIFECAG